MPVTVRLGSLDDPAHAAALAPYTRLTEAQARALPEPVFIVESPKVLTAALDAGLTPVSMLCEERHIEGDAAGVLARCPATMPVYTGGRDLLAQLTGYTLTRGVLGAFRRPQLPSLEQVCSGARRLAVIAGVVDNANVGSIFRAAAGMGIDGVVMAPGSCDPLNRRAVRVSMGTVFRIPWTVAPDSGPSLRRHGFRTAALALKPWSIPVDSPAPRAEPRLAIILGNEGDGLPDAVIADADYSLVIPMHRGVDSLNVASAAAVAFYALRP